MTEVSEQRDLVDVTNVSNRKGRLASTITVLHVRRWVRWWFYVGVACGAVALANIFFRNLTRAQEDAILFVGVMHWLLGGLVCWALDGIKVEKAHPRVAEKEQPVGLASGSEPNILAHTLLHTDRRLRRSTIEHLLVLTDYLKRWEKQHHA